MPRSPRRRFGHRLVAKRQPLARDDGESPTVTRFDSDGSRTDIVIASDDTIALIGQGGAAYLRQMSGAQAVQPVMDLLTWTPRWSLPYGYREACGSNTIRRRVRVA